jgi:hypothetical protein
LVLGEKRKPTETMAAVEPMEAAEPRERMMPTKTKTPVETTTQNYWKNFWAVGKPTSP